MFRGNFFSDKTSNSENKGISCIFEAKPRPLEIQCFYGFLNLGDITTILWNPEGPNRSKTTASWNLHEKVVLIMPHGLRPSIMFSMVFRETITLNGIEIYERGVSTTSYESTRLIKMFLAPLQQLEVKLQSLLENKIKAKNSAVSNSAAAVFFCGNGSASKGRVFEAFL